MLSRTTQDCPKYLWNHIHLFFLIDFINIRYEIYVILRESLVQIFCKWIKITLNRIIWLGPSMDTTPIMVVQIIRHRKNVIYHMLHMSLG